MKKNAISKMDKTHSRTPEDVERKYGLGKLVKDFASLKAKVDTIRHIKFYDADGVVVASYVINSGDKINSPIADVVWINEDGKVITFPYTPTSDTNLYVQTESTQ